MKEIYIITTQNRTSNIAFSKYETAKKYADKLNDSFAQAGIIDVCASVEMLKVIDL